LRSFKIQYNISFPWHTPTREVPSHQGEIHENPFPSRAITGHIYPVFSGLGSAVQYWLRGRGQPFRHGRQRIQPGHFRHPGWDLRQFQPRIRSPAGFGEGHEEENGDHGHDEHGHGVEEGFQLRETELAISGAIDPYLDASVTAAIGEDGIELEEAYLLTTALPAGLQIKAGKFLSDVGYINRQHPHSWDFVDQPWMREFLFGDEGLNETGVQLSWVAPTAQYTRLGVEVLEGENEGVANHLGDSEPGLEGSAGPRLVTAFASFAPNLGYDHALQLGVSGGFTDAFQQRHEHDGSVETLRGQLVCRCGHGLQVRRPGPRRTG